MKEKINIAQREMIEEFTQELDSKKIKTNEKDIIFFRDDKKKRKSRIVFKVPLDLLRYRKDNGRITSDVYTYEANNGMLDENTDYGQFLLKGFLQRKDPEKTEELKNSIRKDGQLENAVITSDGFLINGNRRKMVLEELSKSFPRKREYKFLKVVILPNGKDESAPKLNEIEEIENRYQLQNLGKADYYNFDKALSIQRKLNMGITLDSLLKDDPSFAVLDNKQYVNRKRKFKDEFLEPLKGVERYLFYFNRKSHYNTISEGRNDSSGRWQAFLDYYKSMYKKLENQKTRDKLGFKKADLQIIDDIAFKLIRLRDFKDIRKKTHQIMRDLPKLLANENSRKVMYGLYGKDKYVLDEFETINELGKPLDEKTKDNIWINKYREDILKILKKAYYIIETKEEKDTPLRLLNESLKKLNHYKLDFSILAKQNLTEAQNILNEMKDRLEDLDQQLIKYKKIKS